MTPEETLEALCVDRDALEEEVEDIDEQRARIKGQLEGAQAHRHTTGEYADADWYRRATGAARHLGVKRNALQRKLGYLNRQIKAWNSVVNDNTFRIAVQENVDDATYQRIIARHQQLLSERVLPT